MTTEGETLDGESKAVEGETVICVTIKSEAV